MAGLCKKKRWQRIKNVASSRKLALVNFDQKLSFSCKMWIFIQKISKQEIRLFCFWSFWPNNKKKMEWTRHKKNFSFWVCNIFNLFMSNNLRAATCSGLSPCLFLVILAPCFKSVSVMPTVSNELAHKCKAVFPSLFSVLISNKLEK